MVKIYILYEIKTPEKFKNFEKYISYKYLITLQSVLRETISKYLLKKVLRKNVKNSTMLLLALEIPAWYSKIIFFSYLFHELKKT